MQRHPVTEIAEIHDEMDREQAIRESMARTIVERWLEHGDLKIVECGGSEVIVFTKQKLIDAIATAALDLENW